MKYLSTLLPPYSLSALSAPQPVRAQFQEMARRVPGTANAIVLVNASKIMASPIAKAEMWQVDRAKRFASGLTSVPPMADQLLIASQLDLEAMQPIWEAALVRTGQIPSLEAVAKRLNGTVDNVADLPAVRLSDDSYIVQLSANTVGMLAPGNRQLLARWIREPAGSLSPYLQEAVGFAERGGAVYMAIDLSDTVTAEEVLAKIEGAEDEDLEKRIVDKQAVAQLFASIKGAMLGITFSDRAYGKLRVDFGQDVAAIAPIVKPLMLFVLTERGVMVDEFADWKATAEGTRISLEGALTASGLTRLSSLIDLPTQALNHETKESAEVRQRPLLHWRYRSGHPGVLQIH